MYIYLQYELVVNILNREFFNIEQHRAILNWPHHECFTATAAPSQSESEISIRRLLLLIDKIGAPSAWGVNVGGEGGGVGFRRGNGPALFVSDSRFRMNWTKSGTPTAVASPQWLLQCHSNLTLSVILYTFDFIGSRHPPGASCLLLTHGCTVPSRWGERRGW